MKNLPPQIETCIHIRKYVKTLKDILLKASRSISPHRMKPKKGKENANIIYLDKPIMIEAFL